VTGRYSPRHYQGKGTVGLRKLSDARETFGETRVATKGCLASLGRKRSPIPAAIVLEKDCWEGRRFRVGKTGFGVRQGAVLKGKRENREGIGMGTRLKVGRPGEGAPAHREEREDGNRCPRGTSSLSEEFVVCRGRRAGGCLSVSRDLRRQTWCSRGGLSSGAKTGSPKDIRDPPNGGMRRRKRPRNSPLAPLKGKLIGKGGHAFRRPQVLG